MTAVTRCAPVLTLLWADVTARPLLLQDHRAAVSAFALCFAATLLLSAAWLAPQTSPADAVRYPHTAAGLPLMADTL